LLTYEKIVAILLIALVGAITIALQALKVIDISGSLTDIWILVAAILLGVAKSEAPELFETYKNAFDFIHHEAKEYKGM
jgi:hypothetical protein